MTPVEELRGARARIADPEKYLHANLRFRDDEGRYCVVGALNERYGSARSFLEDAAPSLGYCAITINFVEPKEESHRLALECYDRAIVLAEGAA